MGVSRVFDPVALEGAQVVGVAQLHAELLEDCPVPLLALVADLLCEVTLEIAGYPVIVQQRIVHIEKKHHCARHYLPSLFSISGRERAAWLPGSDRVWNAFPLITRLLLARNHYLVDIVYRIPFRGIPILRMRQD
ncbi:MAG: hypothetical protein HKM86_12225 [Deltaproteobacteria bacterium]|nr:hypothetical protein [Deltaproteobacteria bacterium]